MNLILLRNVMIYFDLPARRRLLTRMAEQLHPDGLLVLGAMENIHGLEVPLKPVRFGRLVAYRAR